MTSDKQIIEINWKAGKQTTVLAILAVIFSVVIPKMFDENYTTSIFLFLIAQIFIIGFIITFFYAGVSRVGKAKASFALLGCVSFLGLIANLFDQSFMMIGKTTIMIDIIAMPVLYVCATLTTLSYTKLKKVSVERKEPAEAKKPTRWQSIALSINPWFVAALFFGTAIYLGVYPPDYERDRSFAVTFIFFFWAQIGTIHILTNIFFPSKKGNQRSRVYFTILSLALIIGAIANLDYDQVTTRVGGRIDINTVTFAVMNMGGLLTVFSFYTWKNYVTGLKERLEHFATDKNPSGQTQPQK